MKDSVVVTNIQRFSLHDGAGIRTTVFLKGCNLHCPWCSNPENISFQPQPYQKDGTQGVFGKTMTLDEIYATVVKDRMYYGNDGGITFSGGEALLFCKQLEPLLEKLKSEGYHLCVETALFIPTEALDIAMKYFDYFIVDAKIFEDALCSQLLGGSLQLYLRNLKHLQQSKSFSIRIPLIEPYTSSDRNLCTVIQTLQKMKITPDKVELLKGHNLASSKYQSLGISMHHVADLSDEHLEEIRERFTNAGFDADVCKF